MKTEQMVTKLDRLIADVFTDDSDNYAFLKLVVNRLIDQEELLVDQQELLLRSKEEIAATLETIRMIKALDARPIKDGQSPG